MIRASDLIGCKVRSEAGHDLGHVHDLRVQADGDGWRLRALVVGKGGMLVRLLGARGSDPLVRGDEIPWQAITGVRDGLITIRETDLPTPTAAAWPRPLPPPASSAQ